MTTYIGTATSTVIAFDGSSAFSVAAIKGANTSTGDGIQGSATASTKSGVWGDNSGGGYGVAGSANGANGAIWGSNSASGPGVMGTSAFGSGLHGSSLNSHGLYASGGSGPGAAAVKAFTSWPSVAVDGESTGGAGGTGVKGKATGTAGYGVWGETSGSSGKAIYGYQSVASATAYSGYFDAISGCKVHVNGTLSKTAGTFLIDHPLEPTTMDLVHSFVESPEMKNIYDGVGQADGLGELVVTMPSYFESLNGDFRYQLTALDGPAPNLHIKARLKNGIFTVGGANPGQTICWQVTGNRVDAWALANPLVVEKPKAAEHVGRYWHPVPHGAPECLAIGARAADTDSEGRAAKPKATAVNGALDAHA